MDDAMCGADEEAETESGFVFVAEEDTISEEHQKRASVDLLMGTDSQWQLFDSFLRGIEDPVATNAGTEKETQYYKPLLLDGHEWLKASTGASQLGMSLGRYCQDPIKVSSSGVCVSSSYICVSFLLHV